MTVKDLREELDKYPSNATVTTVRGHDEADINMYGELNYFTLEEREGKPPELVIGV